MNGAQRDCTKNNNVSALGLIIGRTRIMRIYLLGCGALVETDEPMEKVVACGVCKRGSFSAKRPLLFKNRF